MRLTPLQNPTSSIRPKKVRSQPPLPWPKTAKSNFGPLNASTSQPFLRTSASSSLSVSLPLSNSEPFNASTPQRNLSSPVNFSNSIRRSSSSPELSSYQPSSDDSLSSLREGLGGPIRPNIFPPIQPLNLSSFRLRYKTLNSSSRLYERWLQNRPSVLPAIDFSILFQAKKARANVSSLKAMASASMFDVKILENDLFETLNNMKYLQSEISDLKLMFRDFCRDRAITRGRRDRLKSEFYETEVKAKLISLEILQLEREIHRSKNKLDSLIDMKRNLKKVEPLEPRRYVDKRELMRKLMETDERLALIEEEKLKEGEEVRRLNSELSQFNKNL